MGGWIVAGVSIMLLFVVILAAGTVMSNAEKVIKVLCRKAGCESTEMEEILRFCGLTLK